ncbi:Uncharacterised protein [Weissella viridescens]|uniref:Uncharacterized protein n=1 Tax=Weissella viridescens TaxID=1629 RepID=A0A380P3Z2_WEIVI|nr:Uncharacterised protein [Weissella viridescens]
MHQLVFEPLGLHETGYRTPAMPGFYDLPKNALPQLKMFPSEVGYYKVRSMILKRIYWVGQQATPVF